MNNQNNSFSDDELRGMITGNNPVSNAYRELLAYREAAKTPVAWVDKSDVEHLMTGKCKVIESNLWAMERFDETPLYAAPQLPAVPDEPTDDERIMAIEGIIQPLDEFDSSNQQFESLRRGESD